MKTILLFCSVLLIILSCSKNQRQINKIEGKWNVVSAQLSGFGEIDPDIIYNFDYCKLKQNNNCDFSIHNFDTEEVTSGVYTILDQGTKIGLTVTSAFGFAYREYEIIKLTNRKMILENNTAPSGELSRIELRSVD